MKGPTRREWFWYKDSEKFLPTWRKRFRFLVTVAILMWVSGKIGHAFLFEPFSAWYHDIQLRRMPREQERYTRIVRIDAADHRLIFGGRSPLFGDKIVQAVCAVASRGPRAVVVDLDTSSELDFPEGLALPQWPVPVIWAADADSLGSSQVKRGADPILGGRLEPHPLYGVAKMPADFDDVVRRWSRWEQIGGYARPTLAWAAVTAFCGDKNHESQAHCPDPRETGGDSEGPEAAAFAYDLTFLPIGVSEFLERDDTGGANPRGFPASCPAGAADDRLKGRIAILGGSFSRTDEHYTAWGKHQGAELVAMAIEQALRSRDGIELGEYALLAVELAIAFLIGAIHHWIRPIPATVITLVLLPLSVMAAAECTLYFAGLQVGIVPFVVGMLIHQLAGSAERAEEMVRRLEEAKAGELVAN